MQARIVPVAAPMSTGGRRIRRERGQPSYSGFAIGNAQAIPRGMQSTVSTPDAHIASQPADRQETLRAVRAVLRDSLEKGFEEGIDHGMITYCVPLSRYPDTYNGRPLGIAALAAQKGYYALYLMSVYGDPKERERFEDAYRKAGKRLDMGKSCVRFRSLDDLPLDVVADALRRVTVEGYLKRYEEIRSQTATGKKTAAKKAAAPKAPAAKKAAAPKAPAAKKKAATPRSGGAKKTESKRST